MNSSKLNPKRNNRVGAAALSLAAAWVILVPPGQSFASTNPVSDEFKHWEQVQRQGKIAFENCEFGKAERLLKQAVEEARNIGPGDVRIAQSPQELGRLLTVRGRFKEAQQYLEEAFYLKDRALGDDIGLIVADMENLISFYLNYGSAEKANPLTEDLLDFVQGKYKEQAVLADSATKVILEKDQPLVGWAGTAAPAMRDPMLEWAISCDKLGDLYRGRGDLSMADRLYKTGLDLKATILGKKHLSLANSYDNLASICLKKKELKDAESYYRDALDITEGVLEPGDPQVYARMSRLANCLIAQRKYSEAEETYRYAAQRWQGSNGSGIEQRALFALGCLYSDQKRYAAAAGPLKRALKLSERMNGAYSISLVPYLRKYGYVMYYLGARGESQNLQARANSIAPVIRELKAVEAVKIGRLE